MSDSTRESTRHGRVVVIGASLGGLDAIRFVLTHLSDCSAPIVVCQHRGFSLEERLEGLYRTPTGPKILPTEDKTELLPGCAYVAPPGYHTLVGRGELTLSTEAPVCFARPSIDVLFESAADAYGPGVVGVLMTGASNDGAQGLAVIKRCGGIAVVQDPDSALAQVMPRSALAVTNVDAVLPVEEIGPYVSKLIRNRANYQ